MFPSENVDLFASLRSADRHRVYNVRTDSHCSRLEGFEGFCNALNLLTDSAYCSTWAENLWASSFSYRVPWLFTVRTVKAAPTRISRGNSDTPGFLCPQFRQPHQQALHSRHRPCGKDIYEVAIRPSLTSEGIMALPWPLASGLQLLARTL